VVRLAATTAGSEGVPRVLPSAGGERTLAWLWQSRQFNRDYERLCAASEALIYAAMGRLMVPRLPESEFSDSF